MEVDYGWATSKVSARHPSDPQTVDIDVVGVWIGNALSESFGAQIAVEDG